MKTFYAKILRCLPILMLSSSFVLAQNILGKVTDENGDALVGVTVLEKGTRNGSISDLSGAYNISLQSKEAILVFSFIGFKAEEMAVNNQSIIDITLIEDVAQLQELVVIGYGTQKKANLSGAVDQIEGKQIESRPVSNIAQGLQGMVPNLNVNFPSGEPGATANINIRGITSINGGNPLILIDGVPSDAAELNRISPQDLESISVIKDASAAAIYGARAAFGVIILTTKSGSKEGIRVNYSNNFSWDRPTVLPEKITDPYIFSRMLETSTDNTPWDYVNYSDQYYLYAKQRSDDPSMPGVRVNPTDETQWEYMGNKDWTRYFLDDYSVSQNHALSFDGRSNDVSYFISGGYNRQNGALSLADDFFDRFSFRSKLDYSPKKWLKVGNNTFYTSTVRKKPTYFSMWDLYNFFPTDYDKNPDGSWANTEVGRAGAKLTDGGGIEDRYSSIQSRFTTEFSLVKDILKLNADYTFRRGSQKYDQSQTRYNIGFGPDDIREEGSSKISKQAIFDNYSVLNLYTSLNKSFENHHVSAIVGYNQEYFRTEGFAAERNNLISSSFPSLSLATGDVIASDSISGWALKGAFYRLGYNYNDKYILEFNGRYDGSSRFPKENRFGFFPSASAAWRVEQEDFLSPVRNLVSTLKFRGSYGSLGNQSVPEYGYIPTMEASLSNYLIGGARSPRVTPPRLVSPNYTWEVVTTLNGGVDFGAFKDRLLVSFDIYKRDTKGMLTLGRELPSVIGAVEPRENAADLETKGWELSIGYQNEVRVGGSPLSFTSRFMLADSRSFITRFDNPNGNITQFYEGMELGEIWGLQSDGFFQSQNEIEALDQTTIIPWGALTIVPGWPKYKDLDDNGSIEKGQTIEDPKDLSVIGNFAPRLNYGIDLSMNWKGFDLRAFFQGVGKKDYYPVDYLYWGFYQQPYAGGYTHLLDFYRPGSESEADRQRHSQSYLNAGLADQNLDAQYPILQAWLADRNIGERIDEAQGLAIPQTSYLLDGSYLRLKNLTLGYSIPASIIQKIGLSGFRVFASGENLAEWSKIKKFFDPEAINDKIQYNPSFSSNREMGSGYTYPVQRRYAFGVNVSF